MAGFWVRNIEQGCCNEAAMILDRSQGTESFRDLVDMEVNHQQRAAGSNVRRLMAYGHPNAHVECSENYMRRLRRSWGFFNFVMNNMDTMACAQSYAIKRQQRKTAFVTKNDQIQTFHVIMSSDVGLAAIDCLREGYMEVAIWISMGYLETLGLHRIWMSTFNPNGVLTDENEAGSFFLIIGIQSRSLWDQQIAHYFHVKTFFPMVAPTPFCDGYAVIPFSYPYRVWFE